MSRDAVRRGSQNLPKGPVVAAAADISAVVRGHDEHGVGPHLLGLERLHDLRERVVKGRDHACEVPPRLAGDVVVVGDIFGRGFARRVDDVPGCRQDACERRW